MKSLFELFTSLDAFVIALIIVGITFVIATLFTYVISLKMRGTKSFFLT